MARIDSAGKVRNAELTIPALDKQVLREAELVARNHFCIASVFNIQNIDAS